MNNSYMDKRQHERISSLNLSYVCVDEQGCMVNEGMGRTLNVSEAGILLEVHFPIQLENTLTLSIVLNDELIDLRGKVVHCGLAPEHNNYQVGVQFIDIDDEAHQGLKAFIDFFEQLIQY